MRLRFRTIAPLLLVVAAGLATAACPEKKGPAEKAGEQIDKAVDETKDAVKDVADDVKKKGDH